MTPDAQAVLPYLQHVEVVRTPSCVCPEDSWAPCGGQYAGHYSAECLEHRFGAPAHFPSQCPRS